MANMQWSETLNFEDRHTLPPISHPVPQPRPHTLAQPPKNAALMPGQPMSLAGISLRAFVLGTTTSAGLLGALLLVLAGSPLWRIPFFVGALSTFHFLEYWTTAWANTHEATVHSFLLTANWPAYPIAHTAACVECLVTNLLVADRAWPWPWAPFHTPGLLLMALGFVMVLGGQAVRSAAMVTAGKSFNHTVQTRRAASHTLVTTGVYALCRHPSYLGFFYWGLGTQLVLGNVVCFVAYGYVLWKFFSSRVRVEEKKLVEFFGDDYVEYRKRVGTLMPFVG